MYINNAYVKTNGGKKIAKTAESFNEPIKQMINNIALFYCACHCGI